MNINCFKKGDVITRSETHKYKRISGGLGFFSNTTEEAEDGSFMGDKLVFVGIAAGLIFLLRGDDTIKLDSRWSEGWDFYPQYLEDEAEQMKTRKTV